MSQIELMVTADVPAALTMGLQRHFIVHHREHIRDASVLSRIQALLCPDAGVVGRDIMAYLPQLRMIAVMGADTTGVDLSEAQRRSITVVPTRDVAAVDTADFAMGLLIGLVRRIPMADQFVRAGDWVDGAFPLTRRVSTLRLGILGLGATGLALLQRASAFDMPVAYCDTEIASGVSARFCASTLELARCSDVLITLSTRAAQHCGQVDGHVLQALGAEGLVIVLARGTLADESQAAQMLQARQLGGMASDVHPQAPRVSAALRQARPVIVTPSIAAHTQPALDEMVREVVNNVGRFFPVSGTRPDGQG